MPKAITAYEQHQQTPRYDLPQQARALRRDWWTTTQAAKAWGVSPRTARRYFEEIGETLVLARNTRTARVRVLHCVPANTLRPPVRRGNPHFGDRAYQQELSMRRWEGHITRLQRETFEREYEAAALLDLQDLAAEYLPDPEEVEDWQPYPMPDPEPEPEPFFLQRWERDLYERKQKRQPKENRHPAY